MFANTVNDSKCYIDRQGNEGLNYPVHEQLAQYFKGSILQVVRPVPYASLKVKVYAAKDGTTMFLMVLNKDMKKEHTVRLAVPGAYDLVVRLPAASYISFLLSGDEVTVSGVSG
jgi:polyphosphate kinase